MYFVLRLWNTLPLSVTRKQTILTDCHMTKISSALNLTLYKINLGNKNNSYFRRAISGLRAFSIDSCKRTFSKMNKMLLTIEYRLKKL